MMHFIVWGGVAVATSLILLKAVDFFWPEEVRATPAPEPGYWRMAAVMLNQGDIGNEVRLPNTGQRGLLTRYEERDGRFTVYLDKWGTCFAVTVMSPYDPVEVYDPEAMEARG